MTKDGTERLHTSVLIAPTAERRRARRQRNNAVKKLQLKQREAEKLALRTKFEEEQAERRSTTYLPNAGEPGPSQLRSPGKFKLPRHQDTSATLAGAYPFLAEGGLGSDGVFVGQDLYSGGSFVYDPWVLYARGLITAPNLVLGHGLSTRLNPLDEGYRPLGMSDETWASTVSARRRDLIGALAETVLARPLTPLEYTAIDTALTEIVRANLVPILPMVVDQILSRIIASDPDGRLAEDGRLVGYALRRLVAGDLAGLFDGPSTVRFDPTLPMISLDLPISEGPLIDLPLVIVSVGEMGAVRATFDGVEVPPPIHTEQWSRAQFGELLDALTQHRSRSIRLEVRESDRSVFTEITGSGFIQGEDVLVAIPVSTAEGDESGTARAVIDLDQVASQVREVALIGYVSGRIVTERLP